MLVMATTSITPKTLDLTVPGEMRIWYRPDIVHRPMVVVLLKRSEKHSSYWEVLGCDGGCYIVKWSFLVNIDEWISLSRNSMC